MPSLSGSFQGLKPPTGNRLFFPSDSLVIVPGTWSAYWTFSSYLHHCTCVKQERSSLDKCVLCWFIDLVTKGSPSWVSPGPGWTEGRYPGPGWVSPGPGWTEGRYPGPGWVSLGPGWTEGRYPGPGWVSPGPGWTEGRYPGPGWVSPGPGWTEGRYPGPGWVSLSDRGYSLKVNPLKIWLDFVEVVWTEFDVKTETPRTVEHNMPLHGARCTAWP